MYLEYGRRLRHTTEGAFYTGSKSKDQGIVNLSIPVLQMKLSRDRLQPYGLAKKHLWLRVHISIAQ